MQGTHTGAPFGVYSMAQSRSPYSAVNISGSFTGEAMFFRAQDFTLRKKFLKLRMKSLKQQHKL